MNFLQSLSPKQFEQIESWKSQHEELDEGTIGGRYTYMFTPTSIGIAVAVQDNITKEILDITDYDMW